MVQAGVSVPAWASDPGQASVPASRAWRVRRQPWTSQPRVGLWDKPGNGVLCRGIREEKLFRAERTAYAKSREDIYLP